MLTGLKGHQGNLYQQGLKKEDSGRRASIYADRLQRTLLFCARSDGRQQLSYYRVSLSEVTTCNHRAIEDEQLSS